jgi:hypothetical protein
VDRVDVRIDGTGEALRRIRIEAGDASLARYVAAARGADLGAPVSA